MRKFLVLVLALLMLVPPMSADDHDDVEDETEERESGSPEWEYQVSVSGGTAIIEMSHESGEDERAIEFEYDRDDASVEFSLESETGEIEHESSMEVQFHQIFEYEDENGNERYDAGEAVVQAFDLSQDSEESLAAGTAVTWSTIRQTSVTSDDGVGGTKFSSTAAVGSGSLRFDFYVFADEATLGPASLEATEIKLDIAIVDFPFQSASGAVALFLESESEVEIEDDAEVERDEEGVIADAGSSQLRFAWVDFADVDGQQTTVHTTRLDSETSQSAGEYEHEELLVFSYARGEDIVHDPTMGVSTAAASSNGLPGPGLVLLAGALALAGIAVRRR